MKTALLLVAGLAAGASAQTFYGGGAGGAIPDNGGATGTLLNSSITISDTAAIADLNVNLSGLAHSWVGDLQITLSNGSTSVDLINRPGVPEVSGVGYSWNLGGDYNFDDQAASGFEAVGVQASTFNLAGGDYLSEQALSAFNGASSAGTWTLSIGDFAGLDTGSLGSWGLTITAVPAPSAAALLGLGGLVATRRRR